MKNNFLILKVIKLIGIGSIIFATMMIVVVMFSKANASIDHSDMEYYFYKAIFTSLITDSALAFVFGSIHYFVGKVMNHNIESLDHKKAPFKGNKEAFNDDKKESFDNEEKELK